MIDASASPQPGDYDSLRHENSDLREQLARTAMEAELFRTAMYKTLAVDEIPPTEAEIRELMASPQEEKLLEVIEEYERRLQE